MSRVIVELPLDRSFCGTLNVFSDAGERFAGPFAVAGRACDTCAEAHGNPKRNPLLRYGDTPQGSYRVREIAQTGDARNFGPHGVVVIEGTSGEAALAEANGRYRLFIQGGEPAGNGALRATAGALRLADDDMALLVAALEDVGGAIRCDVIAHDGVAKGASVFVGGACREDDPPPLPGSGSGVRDLFGEVSRRDALRAGAAGTAGLTALSLAVSFVALGTPTPAHAYTQMAYNDEPAAPAPEPEAPAAPEAEAPAEPAAPEAEAPAAAPEAEAPAAAPEAEAPAAAPEAEAPAASPQPGMAPLSAADQDELKNGPNAGSGGNAVQTNPGANTPEAQQIQSGGTGTAGTPPTPAPQISGGAAARQGNTASTGSSAGAAASSPEAAAGTAGAPFDSNNAGSGSSAPAVSASSSTATPTAAAPTPKEVYFQQMQAAGQIADPAARNAATNKANTDYAKALSAPPPATLPTAPPPPPAATTTPAKPPPTTKAVLDQTGN